MSSSAAMAARSSPTSVAGLGGVASAPTPLQPATASSAVLAAVAASTARRDRPAPVPAVTGPPVTESSRQCAARSPRRHPSMSQPVPLPWCPSEPGRPAIYPAAGCAGAGGHVRCPIPVRLDDRTTAQVADEEVVMHGSSRHRPPRPAAKGSTPSAAGPADVQQLIRLLEPVVRAMGMDLENVRITATGRRRLLRVVVDADRGVSLDDITLIS